MNCQHCGCFIQQNEKKCSKCNGHFSTSLLTMANAARQTEETHSLKWSIVENDTKFSKSNKALPAAQTAALSMTFEQEHVTHELHYASFVERVFSGVIDAALLTVSETVLICSINFLFPLERDIWTIALHTTLPMLISFMYYPLLESSNWQATFGKKFLGLMVTDIRGRKLTLTRALFKQTLQAVTAAILFGSIIFLCSSFSFHSALEPTGLLFAGVFVANLLYFGMHSAIVFTEKKQSVFDKITGRLVHKRTRIT